MRLIVAMLQSVNLGPQNEMTCPDRRRLLFRPYIPPRVRKGGKEFCLFRDEPVVVTSWTDARLSWPRCQKPRQRGGSAYS